MPKDIQEEMIPGSIEKRLATIERLLVNSERRANERHAELMATLELSSVHQRLSSLEIKSLVRN